ncbi:hypothetical protein [Butyrivibrio sp. LC3010]|uniref:hypothetical protein n=1 Tax=Butyrivibrio sp. LC3010 TaxID=1280680 RepID=UPI00040233D1|nr:hypothetical protein [Butyrivibrio sp. LC3010]
MDYYAAFLREPGEKLNNDGLMIKGFHTDKNDDVVVMVLSTDYRNGKLSDKVVRTAEKIVNKKAGKCRQLLKKLFLKYSKRGFFIWRYDTDLTILILKGINYYVLNSGKNKVMRAGRLLIEEISKESADYYCTKGRLSEGSTLIAGNEAFFERQIGADIYKRLCPQMCTSQNSMQKNIEYLSELLWSRGEKRPVSAVAVCVR